MDGDEKTGGQPENAVKVEIEETAIAGPYQSRVEFLEARVEFFEKILGMYPDAVKEWTKEMQQIKKKLEDLSEQLEKEKKRRKDEEEDYKRREANFLQNSYRVMKEKNELTRLLNELEDEKEELRRRLHEMEETMKHHAQGMEGEEKEERQEKEEVADFAPIFNDDPVDGEKERWGLRVDVGRESMERMELEEEEGDHFNEHSMEISGMDNGLIENEEQKNDKVDNSVNCNEDVEPRRKSSRKVNKSVKYDEFTEESDEEDEQSEKKRRSESVEKKEKVLSHKRRSSSKGTSHYKPVKKDNEDSMESGIMKNELECLECEYRSRSALGWVEHLRRRHSTNPALASCLLRCDCGDESHSNGHSYKCNISNFTIIRTGDGQIRRLTDPVATPQCVLCEAYPKTPFGYIRHLTSHHASALVQNRIYLKCACGLRFNNDQDQKRHDKKCTGRDFSLHKLD